MDRFLGTHKLSKFKKIETLNISIRNKEMESVIENLPKTKFQTTTSEFYQIFKDEYYQAWAEPKIIQHHQFSQTAAES